MRSVIGRATIFIALCVVSAARAADAPPLLRDGLAVAGDVALVDGAGHAASIVVDPGDAAVVRIVAGLLADDVDAVTGRSPRIVSPADDVADVAILVGTIGHCPAIDRLIADGKLDVARVRGQWETFAIATVDRPLPNVARGVVIAGSDRRGTAYGMLELSEQIGVSPWHWWADSNPEHRDTLTIANSAVVVGPPTVKYRGIFLNDEDWGLTPWASKTFEPEVGNIGPKTYRKIFELMLRLKANYLWPAMHPCSTEFGKIEENVKAADDWAIVMGASHAEPMNRNNVRWRDEQRGDWRYDTNRDGVLNYWREWAKFRGPYEAVWTLGMRGIHDSAMEGPKDTAARVELLGKAIEDQRKLLAEYVDPKVEQIPQAFMPYKEVLALYQAGLKVPDDVTLVWCDENYGYLRQLSTPAEQRRGGASGVYYHASYLGNPKPYLWIDTTPPALMASELGKALDYGANRIWVINVGDLKSTERATEFSMRLAWNAKRYGDDPQTHFLTEWATREFGATNADAVASILNEYYRLNFQRKTELLEPGTFSVANYDEAIDRLDASRALLDRVDALAGQIAERQRDPFFELVAYPVRVATLCNEAYLANDLAAATRRSRPAESQAYLARVEAAGERLKRETDFYNDSLAGGKWHGIVTMTGLRRGDPSLKWLGDNYMYIPGATTRPATGPTDAEIDSAAPSTWPTAPAGRADDVAPRSFVERDGIVSIEAEHPTLVRASADARWTIVPRLGRTGPGAIVVAPTTAPSVADLSTITSRAATAEYDFAITSAPTAVTVLAYCLPTYRVYPGRALRYAIEIDDGEPQVIDLSIDTAASGEGTADWRSRVRRNLAIGTSKHAGPLSPGRHRLRLFAIDPGVVVDKLVIDLGGLKHSELGPPETPAAERDGTD